MPWLTAFRRRWWLLPVSFGLLGILALVLAPRHPPRYSPTPARVASRITRQAALRVPGVVSSPLGSEEHIVALGDFNEDGYLDLALTNGDPDAGPPSVNTDPQGAVTLWLGDGQGGLRHGPVLRELEATVLASFDADGDGDVDLLAGSRNDDSLVLWRNQGHGKLVPQFTACEWGVEDLATGDIDGDGDIDLVLPEGYRLAFGLNDGQGHFHWRIQEFRQKPVESNDLFERVALVDVDGDHDLDLVSPLAQGSILFNDGTGHFGHEQRLPGCRGYSLAIGDLNGDARPDLVMAQASGTLAVYLNDGHGHFGVDSLSHNLPHPEAQVSSWVALGDVDRDGDVDLVFNSYMDEVQVHLNNGAAQFAPAYHVPTRFSALEELHVADIDQNGWLDILSPIPEAHPRAGRPARRSLTCLRPGNEYYEQVDQLPTALGGGEVQSAVEAALQAHLVLPPGYTLDASKPRYELQFIIGKGGRVEQPELLSALTPTTDSLLLQALRALRFVPGRLQGQPVRVSLQFKPRLTGSEPAQPGPKADSIYLQVDHPPTFAGGKAVVPWLREQGLNRLILPDSVPLPTQGRLVVEQIVDTDGGTRGYRVLESLSSEIDWAFTGDLGNLPRLVPGRHQGRPVRVALRLIVQPAELKAALTQAQAERAEARTRQRGLATRHPGETDAEFVRRVLPLSLAYNGYLMSYAWRPGAYGKQLFLTIRGQGDNEYGSDLLVLDPYRPHTYALRILPLESMGDLTNLESLFFADVDRDGSSEMLALKECSLRDVAFTDKHGQSSYGHFSHYATDVFRLAGTDRSGHPRYRLDATPRPYLDELSTAGAVRRVLARRQR